MQPPDPVPWRVGGGGVITDPLGWVSVGPTENILILDPALG